MLRVAKVSAGGHAYYLDAADPRSSRAADAPGRWIGSGPEVLGLSGVVASSELWAVLAGRDPASGEVLGRAHRRVRVAAFDLTFSAPKSVSLLHALGRPEVSEAVAGGHAAAVEAAVTYVERHAVAVRRSGPRGRTTEPAQGTAVAAFMHRTSRALDPHLHTHAVTANLARGPDGSWSALDGRGLYAHVTAAASVYHAQLRYELAARLGVEWGALDRGRGDLVGVGLEARRAFSVRSAQIAAELAGRGLAGPRARDLAAVRTRAAKNVTSPMEELRRWWHERAEAVGLDLARLDAVVDRVPRRAPGLPDPDRLRSVVCATLERCRASATRRDVVTEVARVVERGAPLAFIEGFADDTVRGLDVALPGSPGPDGPGVGERRFTLAAGRGRVGGQQTVVPDHRSAAAADERRALDVLLRRRSMDCATGLGREVAPVYGRGLVGPDRDLGLGFG